MAGRSKYEPNELTPREKEVAALVARGLSNQEIADLLCLSERTVRTHVSIILSKTNLSNRTALSLMIWQRERLRPPDDTLQALTRIVEAVQRRDVFGFLQPEIETAERWVKQWSVQ